MYHTDTNFDPTKCTNFDPIKCALVWYCWPRLHSVVRRTAFVSNVNSVPNRNSFETLLALGSTPSSRLVLVFHHVTAGEYRAFFFALMRPDHPADPEALDEVRRAIGVGGRS
jgi:hypothetical protein